MFDNSITVFLVGCLVLLAGLLINSLITRIYLQWRRPSLNWNYVRQEILVSGKKSLSLLSEITAEIKEFSPTMKKALVAWYLACALTIVFVSSY